MQQQQQQQQQQQVVYVQQPMMMQAQQTFNTGSMQQGYAYEAIPARVEFNDRFKKSKGVPELICFFLFILALVSHLALGFWMMANAVIEIDENGVVSFSESFLQEQADCVPVSGFGRVLQTDIQECQDLWCVFSKAPYIPAVTIGVVPVIGAAFIVALYFFSQTITWLSVIFSCVVYILVGIAFLLEGLDSVVAFLFIGLGAALLILVGIYRKKVWDAAKHLKTASFALSKNLGVFATASILELAVLGFIALHWAFLVASYKVVELEPITCTGIFYGPKVRKMVQYQSIVFFWIIAYVNSTKLIATSMAISTWYFGQEDKPRYPALLSLRAAVLTSGPVVSIGSLITAIVDNIIRQATSPTWFLSPWTCFLKCLLLCMESCIQAFTRFALIAHGMTGEGFFKSGNRVLQVLKRNFVGGYVLSRVGIAVVRTANSTFAIGIGLVAWHWIDQENGTETLANVVDTFGSLLGFIAFVFFYLIMVRRPLFTLLLISLLMDTLFTIIDGSVLFGPIGGIFVSCVAAIILNFSGDVVLDTLDTIFIAYAVSKEEGHEKVEGDGREFVYELMLDFPEAKLLANQQQPQVQQQQQFVTYPVQNVQTAYPVQTAAI